MAEWVCVKADNLLNQSVYAHSSFLSDTPQMGRSFTRRREREVLKSDRQTKKRFSDGRLKAFFLVLTNHSKLTINLSTHLAQPLEF